MVVGVAARGLGERGGGLRGSAAAASRPTVAALGDHGVRLGRRDALDLLAIALDRDVRALRPGSTTCDQLDGRRALGSRTRPRGPSGAGSAAPSARGGRRACGEVPSVLASSPRVWPSWPRRPARRTITRSCSGPSVATQAASGSSSRRRRLGEGSRGAACALPARAGRPAPQAADGRSAVVRGLGDALGRGGVLPRRDARRSRCALGRLDRGRRRDADSEGSAGVGHLRERRALTPAGALAPRPRGSAGHRTPAAARARTPAAALGAALARGRPARSGRPSARSHPRPARFATATAVPRRLPVHCLSVHDTLTRLGASETAQRPWP